MSKDLIDRLCDLSKVSKCYGLDDVSIAAKEAADTIERLEKQRDNFYMDYRMKCDKETKRLHGLLNEVTMNRDDLLERVKFYEHTLKESWPNGVYGLACFTGIRSGAGK